jgi:hypothetical protein
VVGDGHAVRVAAAIVPHRPRASHGLRGVDDPRLGLKLVEESPKALRGREGRGCFRHHPRSHGGAGVEGSKALAAEDHAPGMDGAEEPWRG